MSLFDCGAVLVDPSFLARRRLSNDLDGFARTHHRRLDREAPPRISLSQFLLQASNFSFSSQPRDFLLRVFPDRLHTDHLLRWLHQCLPLLFLLNVALCHELLPIKAIGHARGHIHLVPLILERVLKGNPCLLPPCARRVVQETVCVRLYNQRVLVACLLI